MNVLVSHLGWTLLHFIWQGALIALAAAVLLAALRRASPQQRYLVACGALLACVAWPALTLYQRVHGDIAATTTFATSGMVLLAHAVRSEGVSIIGVLQEHLRLIVGFWACCAAILALRMALGLMWIGKAARQQKTDASWQARLDQLARSGGLARAVRLRVVDGIASPVTAGWWQPVVLMPAALLAGIPPELTEALLAHELGHISRHDYLINLIQNLIEIVLFYHPAVWWLSRRIRAERELIADDFAASMLGEPRRLALALSELEKLQFSTHHLALAANGGDLMSRITRLLRPETPALNWKAAIPVLALTTACLSLAACASFDRPAATADVVVPAVLDFKSCAKPNYPKDDIAALHEGTVHLNFLVSDSGAVTEANVGKSSGFASMDEAARSAIALCHFKPATVNGVPHQEWTKVQYVWTLK